MKTMEKVVYAYMRIASAEHKELERILDHHIDYLVDMNNNPLISTIYGVIVFDENEKDEERKLRLLKNVIDDLLEFEPSDEEIGDNKKIMDCYADMHNLRESLRECMDKQ